MRKLKLFVAALALLVGGVNSASAQGWTGNAPAEGTFFLYNVGADKFINNGDPAQGWGTNAYLQEGFGLDFKLEANAGGYNLNTNVSNGGSANYLGINNGDLWCDQGAIAWTFTAVDGQENTYTINNGDNYFIASNDLKDVIMGASTGDNKSWWKLVSLDDFKTAMAAKLYSESESMDVSVFISGRSFARNDGRNTSWTTSHDGGNWDFVAGASNRYYGNEAYNNTFDVHQTITGLPDGTYEVKCSGFDNKGTTVIYATVNGKTTSKALQTDNSTPHGTDKAAKWRAIMEDNAFAGQSTGKFVVVGGEITLGVKREAKVGSDWCVYDEFRLYYYGFDISEFVNAYDQALAAAKETVAKEDPYETALKSPLSTAISTYEKGNVDESSVSALTTATNALVEATNNVNNSIAAYTKAKSYLDNIEKVLATTNFYTADAYATNYTTPKTKYDNRTLTTEEGNALKWGDHVSGNMPALLLSPWKVGDKTAIENGKPYINTWSTEGNTDGSDFFTPFFEYWVSDGNVLDAMTMVGTMTGLKANTDYSFTIRARVRQTNNQTKIAEGVTMKVGSGDAVDISAGNKFKDTPFFIGNFSAMGKTDADGNLTATITVAANSNISWLSFTNVNYKEGEDLTPYIADYEFALNTATDCRDNDAYAVVAGKERADLKEAITTYASVDNEDKAALIAAKEALETVTNTFVNAVSTYKSFAELNKNVATALGVALPTITDATTAADLKVEDYIVAEYEAAAAYAFDMTNKLGAWTNAPGNNHGESWNGTTGDGSDEYYDLYNAADRAMTQTVTLPAGNYALIAKGRASTNGLLTMTDGKETVTFAHKGNSGRGIAKDGTATFADTPDTYANSNNGRGWEYRVLTFTSDGSTPITLTFNWKTASSNWVGLDDITLKAKNVSESVVVTAAGFATYASDNDLDFTSVDGLTAYKATIAGSTATFAKVTTVPAGEGVLVKGAANTYAVPVTTGVAAWNAEDNAFVRGTGAAVATKDGSTYNYVLSTKGGVVGFYSAAGKTVATNQAYLQTTKDASSRLNIVFDDGTTGISEAAIQTSNEGNAIYNLNGQRVNNIGKGLYIMNGKKVVLK